MKRIPDPGMLSMSRDELETAIHVLNQPKRKGFEMHPTERKMIIGIAIALIVVSIALIWSMTGCQSADPGPQISATSPETPFLDRCTVCGVCPV